MISKIKDFLQGNLNYHNKKHLPQHIQEQAEFRAFLCKPCLAKGGCPHCGCRTPHLFYAPNKTDALNRWGPMMTSTAWETYKETLDATSDNDIPTTNTDSIQPIK
jgi:hypothetical protein|tara:strand:+ start:1493 stop:1807 length:315 start_codon:yes stop_codon:yes gene_type:complete